MELKLRITGFLGSLVLTLAAYFMIVNPHWFHLEASSATLVIFILAGIQALVQLLCFINLWKERGVPWNLTVFLHVMVVILIVIVFSIWIMNRLNDNMMPSM